MTRYERARSVARSAVANWLVFCLVARVVLVIINRI